MTRELFLLIVGVVVVLLGAWWFTASDEENGGCVIWIGVIIAGYALTCIVWGYANHLPSMFGGKL